MQDFPLDIQVTIEVMEPSISHYLREEPVLSSLKHWVTNVDFDKVELLFIPYNERYAIFL